MTTRFESYGHTALGRRLAAMISTPERYAEYRAFSREGFLARAKHAKTQGNQGLF
jgi:hypothetical protein